MANQFHQIQAGFIVNDEPVLIEVMMSSAEEAEKATDFLQSLEEIAILRHKAIIPMTFEELKQKLGEKFDEAMGKSTTDLRSTKPANVVAA
jgi:hypothetical protein